MHSIKETNNLIYRVRLALSLPMKARCAELSVLLDRGNLLELQSFYPLLIESIFGAQGSLGWGLRTITAPVGNLLHRDDFQCVFNFLAPNGPFFRLVYNLLKDPTIKYDFPLCYLPLKLLHKVNNAGSYPFYTDLVHTSAQNNHVLCLRLNPFDHYIFHFAYHLINPWHQRNEVSLLMKNTVYFQLCCEYLVYFLPTDPRCSILPVIHYTGKIGRELTNPTTNDRSPNTSNNSLFDLSTMNTSTQDFAQTATINNVQRMHVWRSETVLTVFIDIWLHNNEIEQSNNLINNSYTTAPLNRFLHYNDLPTPEYIRIVRALVKQIYAFATSAKYDDSYLSDLKKIAVPMLQKRAYIVLRNLMHRWPLDGSFRHLLELWLTFIQPWRYQPAPPALPMTKLTNACTTNLHKEHSDSQFDLDKFKFNLPFCQKPDNTKTEKTVTMEVTRDYLPFIADNLLAYVVIFQQLLPRFNRVDLVCPKMALMLYRISKVFVQPNLVAFIREVELSVVNHQAKHVPPTTPKQASSRNAIGSNACPNTTTSSYRPNTTLSPSPNLPPLSATSHWSTSTPNFVATNKNASALKTLPYGSNVSTKRVSFNDSVLFANSSNLSDSTMSRQTINDSQSPIVATANSYTWWLQVKQKMEYFEGPNFQYRPLFMEPCRATELYELLTQIDLSLVQIHRMLSQSQGCIPKVSGFWASLRHGLREFLMLTDPGVAADQVLTESDYRRVPDYLNACKANLMNMFNINTLRANGSISENGSSSTMLSHHTAADILELSSPRSHIVHPDEDQQSEYQLKQQLSNYLSQESQRERLYNYTYEGDPDLCPIRSDEIAILVRVMYAFAQYINSTYGMHLQRWYQGTSFWSRIGQQMLLAPMTAYRFDKRQAGAPRVGTELPARVSFRSYCTQLFVGYLIVGYLLAWCCGYSLSGYLCCMVAVWLCYKLLRAIPTAQPSRASHRYPTQGFQNIGFDDSFT